MVLRVESARLVVRNDPDHSDGFAAQTKWDQQRFRDWRGDVLHILIVSFGVRHEQGYVPIHDRPRRAVARHDLAALHCPLPGHRAPAENLALVLMLEDADAC